MILENDGERTILGIPVSKKMAKEIRKIASENEQTLSSYIRMILKKVIDEHKKEIEK